MFVSGDADGGTPLWYKEHVAGGFAERVEMVARGQGHTEWSECIAEWYRRFIGSGSTSQADLEAEAVDAGKVLRAMAEAHNRLNIVVLDACRDNPLPKGRSASRGLARMDAPSGTFIAYAAGPGQIAQDGSAGGNGVFTGELVKAIAVPGLPIERHANE